MKLIQGIWGFLKRTFRNLAYRLKPRRQTRWIVFTALWVILIIYLGFGIYFAWQIYAKHNESPSSILVSKIYPFPAASVGGNIIWVSSYYKQLNYIKQFSSKTKQSVPDPTLVRNQIMDQLIEARLLSWQALKNGIKVSKKDVNDAFDQIVGESGGEENVAKVLKDLYGMNEGDFKDLVRQQVVKEKIQNELIANVKILHILVKNESRANEVANKAKTGEAWDQLAKVYSEDVKTRDNWGDLGWVARGDLVIDGKSVPEFEDAAFKAKVGEIFGPIKTEAGYEIGKVEDKRGKVQISFSSWFESIKKATKIIIFLK